MATVEMRADLCLESWKSVYVDLVTTRSHLTFVCICVLVLEGSECVSLVQTFQINTLCVYNKTT